MSLPEQHPDDTAPATIGDEAAQSVAIVLANHRVRHVHQMHPRPLETIAELDVVLHDEIGCEAANAEKGLAC